MLAPRRRAFTLVEMLVVIAIIGILVAMMLPAVQAAREAARRTQCLNNLAQVSIGVQNYEAAHEAYPAGVVNATGPILNEPQGYHHSWTVQVLPYVDQLNVYKHIDQTASVYDAKNADVRRLKLSVFQCPSESGGIASNIGGSNYAGCHNDVEAPIDAGNNGVFILNAFLRNEDIQDGASDTFFLGEKRIDAADLGWMSGTRATLRNAGTPINARLSVASGAIVIEESADLETTPAEAALGETASGEASTDALVGAEPSDAAADGAAPAAGETDQVAGSDESPAAEPPATIPVPPPAAMPPPFPPLYVGGFGSAHPTVVNFAFGDGHVRAISESIDMTVFRLLANRADGQLPSGFDR